MFNEFILLCAAHEKTKNVDDEFAKEKILFAVRRRQRVASQKLAEFLQCDIHYTFRRILTAENAKLYKGCLDSKLLFLYCIAEIVLKFLFFLKLKQKKSLDWTRAR